MNAQKGYFLKLENQKIHISRQKDFPDRNISLPTLRKLEDNILNKCYNIRAFYIETIRFFTVLEMV